MTFLLKVEARCTRAAMGSIRLPFKHSGANSQRILPVPCVTLHPALRRLPAARGYSARESHQATERAVQVGDNPDFLGLDVFKMNDTACSDMLSGGREQQALRFSGATKTPMEGGYDFDGQWQGEIK